MNFAGFATITALNGITPITVYHIRAEFATRQKLVGENGKLVIDNVITIVYNNTKKANQTGEQKWMTEPPN